MRKDRLVRFVLSFFLFSDLVLSFEVLPGGLVQVVDRGFGEFTICVALFIVGFLEAVMIVTSACLEHSSKGFMECFDSG